MNWISTLKKYLSANDFMDGGGTTPRKEEVGRRLDDAQDSIARIESGIETESKPNSQKKYF